VGRGTPDVRANIRSNSGHMSTAERIERIIHNYLRIAETRRALRSHHTWRDCQRCSNFCAVTAPVSGMGLPLSMCGVSWTPRLPGSDFIAPKETVIFLGPPYNQVNIAPTSHLR
jgi:hypothetical protein